MWFDLDALVFKCANVGDSRLIVGVREDGRIVAKDVSEDHKPDAPLEKVVQSP